MSSDEHPIVYSGEFYTAQDYCIYLIHLFSYLHVARDIAGKTVLDLGCNNGYGTDAIAGYAGRVIGLDVSPNAISDATRRFARPNVEFKLYDGKRIPFDDNTFDAIVSFQVIEHVYDVEGYLSQCRRVLKPGGKAIFTTPNADVRLDPGMAPWNPYHLTEYSGARLLEIVKCAFPETSVQGLFGRGDIAVTEMARCTRARAEARRRNQLSFVYRRRLKKIVKAMLPAKAVSHFRHPVGGEQAKRPFNVTELKRYRMEDLFYANENLETSLDLMAIAIKEQVL